MTAGVVDLTMDTALVIANGLEIAKNAFGYSTWCPYFPMQKIDYATNPLFCARRMCYLFPGGHACGHTFRDGSGGCCPSFRGARHRDPVRELQPDREPPRVCQPYSAGPIQSVTDQAPQGSSRTSQPQLRPALRCCNRSPHSARRCCEVERCSTSQIPVARSGFMRILSGREGSSKADSSWNGFASVQQDPDLSPGSTV